MFTLFTGRHVGGLKEVLQHGGSILRSVILCGTFRRISQLRNNAHSLNLENCLLYLSSTISEFFDFVRCIVFDFIFYCVTVHTLFTLSVTDTKFVITLHFMRGSVIRRNDEASVSIPTTLFTSINHCIGSKHVVTAYRLKTITEITVSARG